ncbi:MAG: nucleotide disphospho-sugar-binding domain-containing protein [Planctomycetota bacterium]
MAHVLCTTTGLAGMLHASLQVARRLIAAGHRVTYACPLDVADVVRAAGVAYVQLPPIDFDPAPQVDTHGGRLGRKLTELRTAGERRRAGVAALRTDAFERLLQEAEPDLVLLDLELDELILTAIRAARRVALISPFFAHEKRAGLPPLDSDVVPGSGWRGSRIGLELEWLRARTRRRLAIARTWTRYHGTDRRGVLLELAGEVGFPRTRLGQLDFGTVFTYRGLPKLSMTARELDFPHDELSGFEYVGPMVRPSAGDPRVDERARAEVARVLDDAERAGSPVVHASVTSMRTDDGGLPGVLPRLVEAARRRPDWTLVLGLGGRADADLGSALPPNAHAFRWLPQLDVVARAACSVHHGGIHTIHECVAHEVPMLVASGGRFDQDGNTARVVHRGLGVAADPVRDDAEALVGRIAGLLEDDRCRARLATMRESFERYASERRLECAVDSLLSASGRSSSGSS